MKCPDLVQKIEMPEDKAEEAIKASKKRLQDKIASQAVVFAPWNKANGYERYEKYIEKRWLDQITRDNADPVKREEMWKEIFERAKKNR